MSSTPDDPFALAATPAFAPTATRSGSVVGLPVELIWLPERRARRGRPRLDRPPFPPSFAERIIADEAVWEGQGLVLTPNRHPFADRQVLLWTKEPRREPDARLLECGFELAAGCDGALLINCIGAAASIPWCHAHLIGTRSTFLAALPLAPLELPLAGPGVEVLRAVAPFPAALVALRGPIGARAAAAERLIRLRSCAAFNLVDSDATTWLFPRTRETPAPFFPQALGSSELFGRWCYDEEEPFARATPADLEAALALAGCARDGS